MKTRFDILVRNTLEPLFYAYEGLGIRLTLHDLRTGGAGRKPRWLTEARARAAARLYATGLMTMKEIGVELGGRCHTSVHYWLDEVAPRLEPLVCEVADA